MSWYSIIPLERSLAPGADDIEPGSRFREVRIGGVLMEVEPMGEEQARIVRLLDCGLEHYLNSSYAPGSIVRYIPTIAADENEAKG
ncbi:MULTISPECIES: YlzJ-like family protein [Paenibacillus]|uniref:YlzJ-like protein n=2 Tax=Paenibacillus lactis TaxID=228574 RepID=G4HBI8_9BACL|nr:YlzJ-like family protein [Paenibacillus lactis]EHB67297.1 hypothetical protein PaelaDRAFT_1521 [Paenibacillus lactis 154]MBP1894552.1 hypothetical protein [Paenibacillus lactis]HAF98600.1 hypothetical protein [Paenibacillus lactis]